MVSGTGILVPLEKATHVLVPPTLDEAQPDWKLTAMGELVVAVML